MISGSAVLISEHFLVEQTAIIPFGLHSERDRFPEPVALNQTFCKVHHVLRAFYQMVQFLIVYVQKHGFMNLEKETEDCLCSIANA